MNVRFRESFIRDLGGVRDKAILERVEKLLLTVEGSHTLSDLPNLKKLRGGSNFYRIRLGDYRLGLTSQGENVTFVRFLHRREIYRFFP